MNSTETPSFWRPALAAAAATCSGIGLARFAYVPLFPVMVAAGWVDGAQAGFLGAANLAGYLVGALGGRRLAARTGTATALDLGMALAAISLAACAWPCGVNWLLAWRTLAGAAGGVLMGLAGPATQASVAPGRRGMAAGIVIGGVATGISVASVAVPLLVHQGIAFAWLGLAAAVLGLWAFAHPRWPDVPVSLGASSAGPLPPHYALLLTYGLAGAGMVAPMVYLSDLAVRGRGLPLALASGVWLLFGLGGIAGTLLGGRMVDRLGARRCFRWSLWVQVAGLAMTLPPWPALLAPAAVTCGVAAVGITAVLLSHVRERAGAGAGALWARTTVSYAIAQAGTAFPLAALFAATGESHVAVFGVGLGLSLAALATSLADR